MNLLVLLQVRAGGESLATVPALVRPLTCMDSLVPYEIRALSKVWLGKTTCEKALPQLSKSQT